MSFLTWSQNQGEVGMQTLFSPVTQQNESIKNLLLGCPTSLFGGKVCDSNSSSELGGEGIPFCLNYDFIEQYGQNGLE